MRTFEDVEWEEEYTEFLRKKGRLFRENQAKPRTFIKKEDNKKPRRRERFGRVVVEIE